MQLVFYFSTSRWMVLCVRVCVCACVCSGTHGRGERNPMKHVGNLQGKNFCIGYFGPLDFVHRAKPTITLKKIKRELFSFWRNLRVAPLALGITKPWRILASGGHHASGNIVCDCAHRHWIRVSFRVYRDRAAPFRRTASATSPKVESSSTSTRRFSRPDRCRACSV